MYSLIFESIFNFTFIRPFLEDYAGRKTGECEAPVYFSQIDEALLGFADILDDAILYDNMPQRTSWIEMNA